MYKNIIHVLINQGKYLENSRQKEALKDGVSHVSKYYVHLLISNFSRSGLPFYAFFKSQHFPLILKHLSIFLPLFSTSIINSARRLAKKCLPAFLLRALYKHNFIGEYYPPIKKVAYGDFGRVTPLSTQFGFDRGGPIDRYYIEKFLSLNAHSIRGRALEVGDNEYTTRYGGSKISASDIVLATFYM